MIKMETAMEDDDETDEVEECRRCNGSGEVAINPYTCKYVCAGPVPDDSSLAVSTCSACWGTGYIEA